MIGDEEVYTDIMRHVHAQITDGTWKLLGWWRAATTKDDVSSLVVPKVHIVNMEKNGVVAKYALPLAADNNVLPPLADN